MRLGVRVGEGCAKLHDALMRDLQVPIIEVDEVWSYVAKKQRRLTPTDGTDVGSDVVAQHIALPGSEDMRGRERSSTAVSLA
jgi:hypothetical protein